MLQFTIAPDYSPSNFGTWYLLGDFVRREMNCTIHLNMPGNSDELADTLAGQQDGMAYVNPFSASKLIREQGWIPLLKPACGSMKWLPSAVRILHTKASATSSPAAKSLFPIKICI